MQLLHADHPDSPMLLECLLATALHLDALYGLAFFAFYR
jgi:hypothetical protein